MNAIFNKASFFLLKIDKNLLGRVAQTCVGAFIVVEFFSVYGGYTLYGFFGDNVSFILLCVISFLALFLTLRFGIIVGIFGLLGGFATPILIDSSNPNITLLCSYLLILYICVFYLFNRLNNVFCVLLSSIFVFMLYAFNAGFCNSSW